MNIKNKIICISILSIIGVLFAQIANAASCSAGIIIFQDKKTGQIFDCITKKRLEALENASADLKLQISQIIESTNKLGKKFEKADKNQLYTQQLILSMQKKLDVAIESAKTDKGEEIEKLQIETMQTNRKLENYLASKEGKNTDISPELIDAISNFNFEGVNKILDELKEINETTKENLAISKETLIKVDKSNSYLSKTQDIQLIENAILSKSMGDTGHVAAFERAVKENADFFSGKDLSGVFIGNAKLDGAKLNNSTLVMSNLNGSSLVNSSFINAKMLSMDAADSVFDNSNMNGSYGVTMNLKNSKFRNTDLTNASWAMSDLRGANFSGANLSGMNFSLSDLRGANFSNAKLIGTFFGGADLRGVNFDNAKIEDVDLAGAVLDSNSPLKNPKNGGCATKIAYNGTQSQVRITAVDPVPNSYYKEGFKYNRVIDKYVPINTTFVGALPKCGEKRWGLWAIQIGKSWKEPPVYRGVETGEQFVDFESSIGFHYPHELLSSGGRKEILATRLDSWATHLTGRAQISVDNIDATYLSKNQSNLFKKTPTPKIPNPLYIKDEQTVFLYALKEGSAELLKKINWNSLAKKIHEFELRRKQFAKPSEYEYPSGRNKWEPFFPESIDNSETQEPEITSIFQEKIAAQSKTLPKQFHLMEEKYIYQDAIKKNKKEPQHFYNLDKPTLENIFALKNPYTKVVPIPVPEKALSQKLLYDRNKLIWLNSLVITNGFQIKDIMGLHAVLRLPKPLSSYELPIKEIKKNLNNNYFLFDLTFDLKSIEFEEGFAIFNVDLKDIKLGYK